MVSTTADKLFEKYGLVMEVPQIAEHLGLSNETIKSMIVKKQIIGRKAGRKWIVATENFAIFLSSPDHEKQPKFEFKKGAKLII